MKAIERNKTYIFGLGQSGMSVARYFQNSAIDFCAVDTRNELPSVSEIESMSHCQMIHTGKLKGSIFDDAARIIISPGIDPALPSVARAQQDGCEVIGDIDLFLTIKARQRPNAKIIAITGSNGKSTVTDLIYQLIKASGKRVSIGGNFGIPVLDFSMPLMDDFFVLELSSFQLDTCHSLSADVAIYLNMTPDHLDRYQSVESYSQSKQKIYQNARAIIFNADDVATLPSNLREDCQSVNQSISSFAVSSKDANGKLVANGKEALDSDYQLLIDNQCICLASELSLTGIHNLANVLVALLALKRLDIKIDDKVKQALVNYKGLSHRFQLVQKKDNVDWVNDSKATNIGATIAALESVAKANYQTVILIAGGDAKGADLSELKTVIDKTVNLLICLGKDAEQLMRLNVSSQKHRVQTMTEAVRFASKNIAGKTLVLLSPACASLDMYPNYMARGDDFSQCVLEAA